MIRRASQHNAAEPGSRIDQSVAHGEPRDRHETVKKFGTQAEWLRSMGLDPTMRKSPRPPPSRLRAPQRPGDNKTAVTLGEDAAVSNTQRPLKTRKRPKRFLPTLERPADEAKTDSATEENSVDGAVDTLARLPAIERSGFHRKRSARMKTEAASTSTESARGSSAQQTSSRNVDGGAFATHDSRRELSESESPTELSSDDSSNSASESDWSEEGTSEHDGVRAVERDVDLSGGNCVEQEWHEDMTLGDEEESGDEAESGVAEMDESTAHASPGPRNASRARVHSTVETQKTEQHSYPLHSMRIRKRLIRRRLRESRDDELEQDEDVRLDVLSDDQDGGDIDSNFETGSDIYQSSSKTSKVKTHTPGALRAHDQISRADLGASEDESRVPEATSKAAAAVKKQERKSSAHHAAFQRLMMQYLGLLQCSPPVAIMPVGSGS